MVTRQLQVERGTGKVRRSKTGVLPLCHAAKYGYIRDEKSGVESYPYPVKEGQRYTNLNPGRLFVQQPPKTGKGSRGSFNL